MSQERNRRSVSHSGSLFCSTFSLKVISKPKKDASTIVTSRSSEEAEQKIYALVCKKQRLEFCGFVSYILFSLVYEDILDSCPEDLVTSVAVGARNPSQSGKWSRTFKQATRTKM